jgi:hypothetical protein
VVSFPVPSEDDNHADQYFRAISDEDGPRVASWFYEELFTQDVIDADAVAHALDTAVGKLRMSGVPTHRWVPFIQIGV